MATNLRTRTQPKKSAEFDYLAVTPPPEITGIRKQTARRHFGVHGYFTKQVWKVVKTYIETFTQPGDVVLDPFGGTGVTLVEALLLALGRQTLLLPIEWTAEGWFRVPAGVTVESAIPMPIPGTRQLPLPDASDGFTSAELGLQWAFWYEFDPGRFTTGQGVLNLKARGSSLADSSALTTPVGGHSYAVEIDVEIGPGCSTGLLLFYDPQHATGILLDGDGIGVRLANGYVPSRQQKGATRATLRIVNDNQEVDFYFRLPGQSWQKTRESAEGSGIHHNVLGGFLDLRPAVFAAGSGNTSFRNFRYWTEAKVPA